MLVFLHGKEWSHGCIEVVYQLKVKDMEYLCASHSHVPFYTCCKGWGRAVGVSVRIEIHLHTCVLQEGVVAVRGPTVRTRRIMDVVARLQGPPEIPELP